MELKYSFDDISELDRELKTEAAIRMVKDEVAKATAKFKPFNSPHEGYAVLAEEVDELWDDVKANRKQAVGEAIQVAAMAIRFIVDCGDWERHSEDGELHDLLDSQLRLSTHNLLPKK